MCSRIPTLMIAALGFGFLPCPLEAQSAEGQSGPPHHPCGDQMTVSSYFLEYEATVLGIVNCCTLRVRITGYPYLDPANNPGPIDRKIHLAGISKPKRNSAAAAECEAHLTHALLGSRVHILATFGREHDARWLPVVLHLPNGTDENRQLLLSGLAAFAEQRPYELDWWMACDYQLAEKTAKEQHLGIWAASP